MHATYGVNQLVGVAHGKTNDGHDDHAKPKNSKKGQPNAIGATSVHLNVAHAVVLLFRGRFRSATPHVCCGGTGGEGSALLFVFFFIGW